jgi:uncharacterized protein (TIGR02271 family)
MTEATTYQQWIGRKLVGRDGSKIGRIDQVYVDQRSGRPAWMTVHTGLLGTRTSFVPMQAATPSGDDLAVPYTKDQVKNAPNIEPHDGLVSTDEQQLDAYYSTGDGRGAAAGRQAPGADAPGADAPGADGAMTRSEEEMRVGTETVETGRARLHKHVETEQVQTTIPVSHEEARVEREPITDADRAAAGRSAGIAEDEREVVLHEDRPVVGKEVVPKERVRLDTEQVMEERTISDQVRKERIDVEGVDDPDRGRGRS